MKRPAVSQHSKDTSLKKAREGQNITVSTDRHENPMAMFRRGRQVFMGDIECQHFECQEKMAQVTRFFEKHKHLKEEWSKEMEADGQTHTDQGDVNLSNVSQEEASQELDAGTTAPRHSHYTRQNSKLPSSTSVDPPQDHIAFEPSIEQLTQEARKTRGSASSKRRILEDSDDDQQFMVSDREIRITPYTTHGHVDQDVPGSNHMTENPASSRALSSLEDELVKLHVLVESNDLRVPRTRLRCAGEMTLLKKRIAEFKSSCPQDEGENSPLKRAIELQGDISEIEYNLHFADPRNTRPNTGAMVSIPMDRHSDMRVQAYMAQKEEAAYVYARQIDREAKRPRLLALERLQRENSAALVETEACNDQRPQEVEVPGNEHPKTKTSLTDQVIQPIIDHGTNEAVDPHRDSGSNGNQLDPRRKAIEAVDSHPDDPKAAEAKQISDLMIFKQNQTERMNHQTTEMDTMKAKCGDHDAVITRLDTEKDALQGRIVALEGQISAHAGRATSLNDELQTLKAEKEALEGTVHRIDSDFQTLRTEKQALDGEVQTLKTEKQALDGEVQTLRTKNQDLDGKVQTNTDKIATMEGKWNEFTRVLNTHSNVLRAQQYDVHQLQSFFNGGIGALRAMPGYNHDVGIMMGRGTNVRAVPTGVRPSVNQAPPGASVYGRQAQFRGPTLFNHGPNTGASGRTVQDEGTAPINHGTGPGVFVGPTQIERPFGMNHAGAPVAFEGPIQSRAPGGNNATSEEKSSGRAVPTARAPTANIAASGTGIGEPRLGEFYLGATEAAGRGNHTAPTRGTGRATQAHAATRGHNTRT